MDKFFEVTGEVLTKENCHRICIKSTQSNNTLEVVEKYYVDDIHVLNIYPTEMNFSVNPYTIKAERRIYEPTIEKIPKLHDLASQQLGGSSEAWKGEFEERKRANSTNFMQIMEDSQYVTTLEMLLEQVRVLKQRIDNKQYDEGLYGYNLYITNIQKEINDLLICIQNTIKNGYQIQKQS